MGARVERITVPVRLVLRLRDMARPLLPALARVLILGAGHDPHPRTERDLRSIRRPARRPRVIGHRGQLTRLAAADRHHVQLAFLAGPIREERELGTVRRPPRRGVARRPSSEFDRGPTLGRRDVDGRAILVLLRVDPGHDVRNASAVRRDLEVGDRLEPEEVGCVHAVRKITPPMTVA